MALEYLVSSLPPLAFDARPAIGTDEFAEACRRWASPRDAAAVQALLDGDAGACPGHPVLARWRDIETQMRNAAAAERARARQADAAKWRRPERGCDMHWKARAAAAFRESGPLARQNALDRAAWDAAGELVRPEDPLGIGAVFAYAARLLISTRRSKADTAAGNAVFDRIAAAAQLSAPGKE